MQLVQGGNPRAFELLYDRHGRPAYSLAYRMVGNRVTAEDITQEAFLSIWRRRLRYDRGAAACAPGCSASFTTARSTRCGGARARAAARDATRSRSARRRPSAPTWRQLAGRRRAACGARWRRSRRAAANARAGLLRRLHAQPDRRDAGDAARHRQGAYAARPREDARPAGRGIHPGRARMSGIEHERFPTTRALTCSARSARARSRAFEMHMESCPQCRRTRWSGCASPSTRCRVRRPGRRRRSGSGRL